jgi:hypothetical protein
LSSSHPPVVAFDSDAEAVGWQNSAKDFFRANFYKSSPTRAVFKN